MLAIKVVVLLAYVFLGGVFKEHSRSPVPSVIRLPPLGGHVSQFEDTSL